MTIPTSGLYEIRVSSLHWKKTKGSDEKSQLELFVNGVKKRDSYGELEKLATKWGQNFNRDWLIALHQNDKVKFKNVYNSTLWSDEQNGLFIKLQFVAQSS